MVRIGAPAMRVTAAVALLALAGCSGTVEASYRPPPPPPPSPPPVTAAPTPTPAPPSEAPALVCGPDKVRVEVGGVQESTGSSRAVPLLLTTSAPLPCRLSNPVGVTLLDADGKALTTRIETADLPAGRAAVDAIPPGGGAMVWLQWRADPSSTTTDPETDCVAAKGLRLTLTDRAPAIPVTATLTACDGGTVYLSPAEATASG